MAKISHDQVKNIEYAATHNWSLGFPIPAIIPAAIRGAIDPLGSFFNLHCETTEIPERTVKFAETMIRGLPYKQVVGTAGTTNLAMTFFENSKYSISRLFDAWSQLGVDVLTNKQTPRIVHNIPRGFFINGENGLGEIVHSVELFQVFPETVKLNDFEASGDFQKVNVNFSFNHHKRHI